MFLDADLIGLTHSHMDELLRPLELSAETGMAVGRLERGGKLGVDLAQRYFAILNGQRCLRGSFVESLPDLSWSKFGVEVFLSKLAEYRNIPVATPSLNGVTHHTKESKLGLARGFAYRLQMYSECVYALRHWQERV